jgi:flagellar biosynthesis protein FlhF
MKVKRYTGSTLEKIRETIVKELGENAVIINIQKKTGKGGILSFGQKQQGFEVTAAVEEPVDVDKIPAGGKAPAQINELLETQKEQYRGIRNSIKMLDDKLADVGESLESVTSKIASGPAAPAADGGPKELRNIHEEWRPMLTTAAKKISKTSQPAAADWHEALASVIPTAGGIMFRKTPAAPPDVYVLTGPTGVGKTTTLAKLAAKCVLTEKINVGLITIDTFRVGALDQLREYSRLLGLEIAVAFSASELAGQLQAFYDKDVVFIDTPGRGQFDTLGIKNIRDSLGKVSGFCSLLVVPASLRREDAAVILDSYAPLKPSALIISKTDEAAVCDGLTRLFDVSGLPVVYLTDGQRVPEDIHAASPGVVASLIMPFVKTEEPVKIGDANAGQRA